MKKTVRDIQTVLAPFAKMLLNGDTPYIEGVKYIDGNIGLVDNMDDKVLPEDCMPALEWFTLIDDYTMSELHLNGGQIWVWDPDSDDEPVKLYSAKDFQQDRIPKKHSQLGVMPVGPKYVVRKGDGYRGTELIPLDNQSVGDQFIQ